jgi:UDP-glucose 4-epimerase
MQDEPLIIYGDGSQTRDFIYVKDVARAFILAATTSDSDGETINIAGGTKISISELASILISLTGKGGNIVYSEERPGEVKHSVADITKAGGVLNFKPEYSLEQGLKETIKDSFKSNS